MSEVPSRGHRGGRNTTRRGRGGGFCGRGTQRGSRGIPDVQNGGGARGGSQGRDGLPRSGKIDTVENGSESGERFGLSHYHERSRGSRRGSSGRARGRSRGGWRSGGTSRGGNKNSNDSTTDPQLDYESLLLMLKKDPDELVIAITSDRYLPVFESLLNQYDLPDKNVIVILRVLAKACDSETSRAFLIILLNKLINSAYLRSALTRYINCLAYASRDERDIENELQCIIKLFTEILSKIPTSFPRLPLANLLHATTALVDSGQHIDEDIKSSVDDLIALGNQMAEKVKKEVEEKANKSKRRRPGDEAALLDNEDPPDDYRWLSVIPQQDDIHPNGPVFIRRNKVEGSYDGPEHYLDVQFRLLREDFIRPLREGIAALSESSGIGRKPTQDIRVYNRVQILDQEYTSKGVHYNISFDVSKLRNVKWENSKRLIYGSLLCLSKDHFETFILATVEERKPYDIRRGIIKVKFKNVYDDPEDEVYQMVETTAYYEAYCHVLEGLQEISPRDFPFERYIIKSEPDVKAPFYLRSSKAMKVTYDMTCIMKDENISPLRHKRTYAKGKAVRILDLDSWPSAEDLGLDSSQLKAVQLALTKEFAIIQGPPGTGKTYIGLKVAKVLLENKECWHNITSVLDQEYRFLRVAQSTRPILVVCYTNHALDQFLEGIQEFHPEGIVRVGGRSQSEKMQACSLRTIKQNIKERHKVLEIFKDKIQDFTSRGGGYRVTPSLPPESAKRNGFTSSMSFPKIDSQFKKVYDEQKGIRQCFYDTFQELESISKEMEDVKYRTQELNRKVISEKRLHAEGHMSNEHYKSIVRKFEDVKGMGIPVKPDAMHYWLELLTNKFDLFQSGYFVKPIAVYPLSQASNSLLGLETRSVESAVGPDGNDAGSSVLSSNSYILIPENSLLDTRFSMTILLYYYPLSLEGGPIITFYDKRSRRIGIQISQVASEDGRLGLSATFNSRHEESYPPLPPLVTNGGVLKPSEWNSIGATYDYRSGVLRLWHNGMIVQEQHFHRRIGIASHLPVYIGTTSYKLLRRNVYLLGKVSDFQFYPEAIKQEQIMIMAGIPTEDFGFKNPEEVTIERVLLKENGDNFLDEKEPNGGSNVLLEANAIENLRKLDTEEVFVFETEKEESKETEEAPFRSLDDGGWQIQNSKRKLRQTITREMNKKEKMTDEEVDKIKDVWTLSKHDKWRLYRYWIAKLRERYKRKARLCCYGFEECAERFKQLQAEQDITILTKATIIGMTTTGAAKFRSILQKVKPRIIIVEEAAEVLESHIITSINPGCQHLILIGDHKQLRPSPNVYDLAKDYNLDVSLFERMVGNGMDFQALHKQHRMRPEIARMMEPIYEDLENHESVLNFENIKGVNSNIFFIDHEHLEEFVQEGVSRSNPHEAKYLAALCRYFILQGYDQSKITILTMYVGQLLKLKNETKADEIFKGVRICAVDNFQGEENDIILLSLVRSNEEGNIGFLRISNRVCVALSRARKGFYCIGNLELMCKKEKLWAQIIADMKKTGNVGRYLTLMCQNHPNTIIQASVAKDFLKAPDGGCMLPCHARLDCGHACRLSCHPRDPDHIEYECYEPCTKTLCDLGHKCKKRCYQECGPCPVPMQKIMPQCNHVAQLPCHLDPAKAKCPVACKVKLNCGHQCEGSCPKCFKGRLHIKCEQNCERTLVCGHECLEICAIKCPPCSRECENECVHQECSKKCGEPCEPCKKACTWKCRHYICTNPCGDPCNRPRCNKPCEKTLSCNHRCIGMCGEPCPKICPVCEKDEFNEGVFGNNDDPDARFVELRPCGHVIEVNAMDALMDECCNGLEMMSIQLKRCPACDKPIRTCPRYGNIIKTNLQDVEKVKAEFFDPDFDIKAEAVKLRGLISFSDKFKDRFREIQRGLERKDLSKENLEMRLNQISLFNLLSKMLEEINNTFKLYVEDPVQVKLKESLENEIMALDAREKGTSSKRGRNWQRRRLYQYSDQELEEIRDEILRVQLMVSYRLLNVQIQERELTLDGTDEDDMNLIGQAFDSCRRIDEETLDSHMETLDQIRTSYDIWTPVEAGPIERKDTMEITNSIEFSKENWYKRPDDDKYETLKNFNKRFHT